LLLDHTKLVECKYAAYASNAYYSRQLLKAIGRGDGLVTSDEEERKLMFDTILTSLETTTLGRDLKLQHSAG
jgi:hypothetical protein